MNIWNILSQKNSSIKHHKQPHRDGRKCTKNGAIYPQKRYTFTNKVGQYAISIPLIGSQSRHSHPIKSAFYATLLRFSWDIGIYSATTPLTASRKGRMTKVIRFLYKKGRESLFSATFFYTKTKRSFKPFLLARALPAGTGDVRP